MHIKHNAYFNRLPAATATPGSTNIRPTGGTCSRGGDFGVEPGQFNLPHSVCTDRQGRVYVADRENHRVQIFDDQGNELEQWNNLHRPCGLHIAGDTVYIGQLPTWT